MPKLDALHTETEVAALRVAVKKLNRDIMSLRMELVEHFKRQDEQNNLFWKTLAEYQKAANNAEIQRRLI